MVFWTWPSEIRKKNPPYYFIRGQKSCGARSWPIPATRQCYFGTISVFGSENMTSDPLLSLHRPFNTKTELGVFCVDFSAALCVAECVLGKCMCVRLCSSRGASDSKGTGCKPTRRTVCTWYAHTRAATSLILPREARAGCHYAFSRAEH